MRHILFSLQTIALLLILIFPAGTHSQDGPCTMKLADLPQAPELRGFSLGMTMDQVKARVPQVVFGGTDDLGSSKTTINPDFDPRIDKSTFGGVRTVSLEFLDARLVSLWLGYDSSFKWQTVSNFVQGISQSLRLPNTWKPWKSRGQQLNCADFQMTVTIVAEGPGFRIIDQTAADAFATRREAKEGQEAASDEAPQEAAEILGDSHNKIYYPSGCQPARPIGEADRVVFKSGEEAEKAGYKLAKICQ